MILRGQLVSLSCILLTAGCGMVEKNPLSLGQRSTSPSAKNSGQLSTLEYHQQESINALQNHDDAAYGEHSLEVNYLIELQKLTADASSETKAMLESKYQVLRQILADEVNTPENALPRKKVRASAPSTASPINHVIKVEERDVVFEGPDFTSVYHPRVLEEVNKVFRDFGDLYVKESVDQNRQPVPLELRVHKPWSGYWYPFGDNVLYEGQNAPLAKFDRVLRAMGYDSKIVEAERQRYIGFKPDSWEGLCDAWSLAAITTDEPKAPLSIQGENFSIGDIKALYTFAHLRYSKKMYGMSYRGDAESDGTYQDIKPEAFHRLVEHFLGEEKRAVVIDDMAGVQVWNKPLYRYRWVITQDPTYDYAFLVRGYPWLVKERQKETDELTRVRDVVAPIYNYRLYVDKKFKKNGGYRVVAGQWMGESFVNHPDSVTVPQKDGKIGAHNNEFNKYLDVFNKLFTGQNQGGHHKNDDGDEEVK